MIFRSTFGSICIEDFWGLSDVEALSKITLTCSLGNEIISSEVVQIEVGIRF